MYKLSQTTKFQIIKFINKVFLPFLVYSSLVIVFSIMVYVIFYSSLEQKEIINISIVSFTTIGILIAYKQITMSSDLQKRQFAMEHIKNITEANKKNRDELNKLMDYANLFKHASLNTMPIPRNDIKELIFKKDSNNKLIGNGSKQSPHILTDEGRHIVAHMIEILNNFEIMAIGIINNVYDETIMKDYFKEILNKNYIVYQDFLTYLRTETFLNYPEFCENFEWLCKHWEEKPIKIMR